MNPIRTVSPRGAALSLCLLLLFFLPGFATAAGPDEGFTLFAPNGSTTTYLIENSGAVIHTWSSAYRPGQSAYLLDNGNLLRTIHVMGTVGGSGGGVEEIAWDGTLLWHFEYAGASYLHHHDIEVLPNGNVFLIAWEYKTRVEAIVAGRNPSFLNVGDFAPDHIIEVEPTGPTSGNIVWEWHVWDHLIQDYDPAKANYGTVADHPELVDINFPPKRASDWIHTNSIDYNPDLDQIVISSRALSEIWIIDHSTTTAEAAGHTGGNSGKGGDLLYRWGNPQAYRAGGVSDQTLFGQHDAQWIEQGRPGEGNILIFNNGAGRPGTGYSSVDEIVPPVDAGGHYSLTPGSAFGPAAPTWSYTAPNPPDFFGDHISGAQRLPSGNTLICDGPAGTFFEVTEQKTIVWHYVNSYPTPQQNDVFKIRRYAHYLWADGQTLSAAVGGKVNFFIEAGSGNANRTCLLLGSAGGTAPGTLLPGGLATIPLNRDWFTDFILPRLNTPLFTGFYAPLDGSGSGTAALNTFGPLPGVIPVGSSLYFAYALAGPWDFVSNSLEIEIVP